MNCPKCGSNNITVQAVAEQKKTRLFKRIFVDIACNMHLRTCTYYTFTFA